MKVNYAFLKELTMKYFLFIGSFCVVLSACFTQKTYLAAKKTETLNSLHTLPLDMMSSFDLEKPFHFRVPLTGIEYDLEKIKHSEYLFNKDALTVFLWRVANADAVIHAMNYRLYEMNPSEEERIKLAKFYMRHGANPNAINPMTKYSIVTAAVIQEREQLAFVMVTNTNSPNPVVKKTIQEAVEYAKIFSRYYFLNLLMENGFEEFVEGL